MCAFNTHQCTFNMSCILEYTKVARLHSFISLAIEELFGVVFARDNKCLFSLMIYTYTAPLDCLTTAGEQNTSASCAN